MKTIEVVPSREKDLGGFKVHRLLPEPEHVMIGPFIFFDHMGPANFEVGQGVDVRPHPHINLATVTYLFEGEICHRDNLGSVQIIEPGDINLMIAGNGIVHSERTPPALREYGSRLSGIQCWLALPEEHEEIQPSFTHYAKETLPQFNIDGVELSLLMGTAFGRESPAKVLSNLFYLSAIFPKGTKLEVPSEHREIGAYVASGEVKINQKNIQAFSLAACHQGEPLFIEALEDSQLILLGGVSLGKRYIYWNFVSSSLEKIEKAKADWANGPTETGRFAKIPEDDREFIPLPIEQKDDTRGTVM